MIFFCRNNPPPVKVRPQRKFLLDSMYKSFLFSLALAVPALGDHHGEAPKLPAGLPAKSNPTALKEAGFKPLLNGQDLTGWKKVGGTASYEMKEGALRGFGKNVKGNTFLRTEKEYGDFILTFQFKFLDKTGNSGCMFRAFQKDGKPDGRVTGYQCEHDDFKNGKRANTAGIYDEARRGWLAPGKKAPAKEKEAFTAQGNRLFDWDGWNTIVIKCKGHHLQTFLNGEARADFTDTDEKNTDLKGFIAFQVHGGKSGDILWKNVFLKEL